jgi:hypothetical protein
LLLLKEKAVDEQGRLGTVQEETINRTLADIEEMRDLYHIMAFGGTLEKIDAHLQIIWMSWVDSLDAAQATIDAIDEIINAVKKYISALADIAIEEFIIEPIFKFKKKELDDALKQVRDDFLKRLAEIWAEFRKNMAAAEGEHLKNMEDIRVRFDDLRREREQEIYNERVERLMALAALEQDLRNKGLTSEQQRQQLLVEIDRALADARLGTIEERQIKLAAVQEQITALNELENLLGLSRTEIDASSLARLDSLQQATRDFFTDKRNAAVSALEAERQQEIALEVSRHKGRISEIEAERDAALAKARIAQQAAETRIKTEEDADDTIKRLTADLTKSVVKAIGIMLAKWLFLAIFRKVTEKSTANSRVKTEKTAALKIIGIQALVAKAKIIAANILNPIAAAAKVAVSAVIFGGMAGAVQAFKKGGLIKKRASGGMISGGRGGIDDIHGSLPPKSYVVNRQSSRIHQAELQAMTARGTVSRIQEQVPVAVTSGEWAVLPPTSITHRQRLDEINRDRTGSSRIDQHFSERRFQAGGFLPEQQQQPSTVVNISVPVEFGGTNIITGDEAEISELYEGAILDKIQQSIDNKEIVI